MSFRLSKVSTILQTAILAVGRSAGRAFLDVQGATRGTLIYAELKRSMVAAVAAGSFVAGLAVFTQALATDQPFITAVSTVLSGLLTAKGLGLASPFVPGLVAFILTRLAAEAAFYNTGGHSASTALGMDAKGTYLDLIHPDFPDSVRLRPESDEPPAETAAESPPTLPTAPPFGGTGAFRFSGRTFAMAFREGATYPAAAGHSVKVDSGMPEDARVIAASYDASTDVVVVVVRSADFFATGPDQPPPVFGVAVSAVS